MYLVSCDSCKELQGYCDSEEYANSGGGGEFYCGWCLMAEEYFLEGLKSNREKWEKCENRGNTGNDKIQFDVNKFDTNKFFRQYQSIYDSINVSNRKFIQDFCFSNFKAQNRLQPEQYKEKRALDLSYREKVCNTNNANHTLHTCTACDCNLVYQTHQAHKVHRVYQADSLNSNAPNFYCGFCLNTANLLKNWVYKTKKYKTTYFEYYDYGLPRVSKDNYTAMRRFYDSEKTFNLFAGDLNVSSSFKPEYSEVNKINKWYRKDEILLDK